MAAGSRRPATAYSRFKFDNKAPVALEDLTASLNALAQSYEDYLVATGEALPEAGVKLYVHDLQTAASPPCCRQSPIKGICFSANTALCLPFNPPSSMPTQSAVLLSA
jgi:hypothetical protein